MKNNEKRFSDSIAILRFDKTKVVNGKFYAARKPINIWDVNIDDMVISKLIIN